MQEGIWLQEEEAQSRVVKGQHTSCILHLPVCILHSDFQRAVLLQSPPLPV